MLKRLIFWDFARGSWQYDVIVIVILAFLFLTPRSFFRDQPRIPNVSVISIPNGEFMVDLGFCAETPEAERKARLTPQIRLRAGNPRLTVTRVEPVKDSEGELLSCIAFTK